MRYLKQEPPLLVHWPIAETTFAPRPPLLPPAPAHSFLRLHRLLVHSVSMPMGPGECAVGRVVISA